MKTKMLIAGSMLLGIAPVLILFLAANNNYGKSYDFTRTFLRGPLEENKTLDIKYNSYYIAGATSKQIFLANATAPTHLLKTNIALSDTQHLRLNIEGFHSIKTGSFRTTVDSSFFYVMNGVAPAVFKGNTSDWLAKRFEHDSAYFTLGIPIGPNAFIIRPVSSESNEYVLAKETMSPPKLQMQSDLLQKQIDGLFCTDGMLHYAKDLDQLVYIYHYRNQFICTDTNLKLIHRARTIDPIDTAQIEVSKVKSKSSLTMSSPALMVNKRSAIWKNYLFINSMLMAKNERAEVFQKVSVIDVYDINEGMYHYSFYIPDFAGKKIRDFIVSNDCILALHGHYIIKYNFDTTVLRSKSSI